MWAVVGWGKRADCNSPGLILLPGAGTWLQREASIKEAGMYGLLPVALGVRRCVACLLQPNQDAITQPVSALSISVSLSLSPGHEICFHVPTSMCFDDGEESDDHDSWASHTDHGSVILPFSSRLTWNTMACWVGHPGTTQTARLRQCGP